MQHRQFQIAFLAICMLLALHGTILSAKPQPVVTPVPGWKPQTVLPNNAATSLRLAPGDTCTVMDGEPIYYVYPWVVGDELYKSYQDPTDFCDRPYPYTIEGVGFYLIYLSVGNIYVSADVEEVDLSDPNCPLPGNLLTISSLYEVSLDSSVSYLYKILLPLDTPVVVNDPFFVGIYFALDGNPEGAGVVIDSFPAPCRSYNDWGEGYVDLDTVYTSQNEKVFPGKLLFFSVGTTGGTGGSQPAPAAQFINPIDGQLIGGTVDLWADEVAGSEIVKYAHFSYFTGSVWQQIGVDSLDDTPLRNGVVAIGTGKGLSATWNTAGLTENNYDLRVIISDTLGRADTAIVNVHVDPTPPFPTVLAPVRGQNVCGGVNVNVSCTDENLTFMGFDYKGITKDFQITLPILHQRLGGDVNNNPADNNLVSNGEFGEYCSGPAAAAMALKYWYNQGYAELLAENLNILTDYQLMDRLFDAMHVQDYQGAYDADFVSGLRSYISTHSSNPYDTRINRGVKLNDLLRWPGDDEAVAMIGLGGNPGFWMTVVGFNTTPDQTGQYTFRAANPLTGLAAQYKVKEDGSGTWLEYNAVWRKIEIMVIMLPGDWSVQRDAAGVDFNGNDGWGFAWNTNSLLETEGYFIRATANDQSGLTGSASNLVIYDCQAGTPGDVNNDGSINVADMIYLIVHLYQFGPPPPAGMTAGDVNCDNAVNLVDVTYLFKHLFHSGPAPCN